MLARALCLMRFFNQIGFFRGIIIDMYNWSVDEAKFKEKSPKRYRLWRLTQLINYGLDGEKLNKKEVIEAWPKIKGDLDPYSRRAIE